METWNKLPKYIKDALFISSIVATFATVILGGIYWVIALLIGGNIGLAIAIFVLAIAILTFVVALLQGYD